MVKELNNLLTNPFYLEIEEGVRIWVFRFRNIGLNTECSCHHEGYIQCQTIDPTTEIKKIKTVLLENNIEEFTININIIGCQFSTMEITAPVFRQNAYK